VRHRRTNRTTSMTKASAAGLEETAPRFGAEMLSQGGAEFNFSSSATLGLAAAAHYFSSWSPSMLSRA